LPVNIPAGMQVLWQGKAEYMREIALLLNSKGIRTRTGPVPGGWEPRAWLAVASNESERALAVHHAHLDGMVAREGLPVRDVVCDLDAEQTQCPACLTTFKTAGTTRCPECGLNFG
jgi:hypothetical protein